MHAGVSITQATMTAYVTVRVVGISHATEFWSSSLVKKIVLTMTCLYRNKVSSSGAGVVIPAPKFRRGALRVEDEWTTACLRHRRLAEVNGSCCCSSGVGPVLPKKKSLLKLKSSGAPLVAEREIRYIS